jgi:hypothetical protein
MNGFRFLRIISFLALFTFLIYGCSRYPSVQPTSTIAPPLRITAKTTPLLSGLTPTPTMELNPILSATSTMEPTSTMAFKQGPTLTDSQTMAIILPALKDNKGCLFPCWWGITPGRSLGTEAIDSLQSMGLNVFPIPDKPKFYIPLFNSDILLTYVVTNGIVESIDVETAQTQPELNKKVFANQSPEQILSIYGQPTRVQFDAQIAFQESGARMFYWMDFIYDKDGFEISYSGQVPYQKPNTRFCPTFGGNLDGSIDIRLSSPGTPFDDHQPDSLQDSTGMMPQDLYNLYMQKTKLICFDVPTDRLK